MKALWNFCTKTDSLWVNTIRCKYRCGWRDFPIIDTKRKGSNFWNGLANTWDVFRRNLSWQVGDGETIRFWSDNWIVEGETLYSYCSARLDTDTLEVPISHYVNNDGGWNLNSIGNLLPGDLIEKIANSNTPSIANQGDDFTWGSTPDGRFSTKSAYAILQNQPDSIIISNTIFQTIWK